MELLVGWKKRNKNLRKREKRKKKIFFPPPSVGNEKQHLRTHNNNKQQERGRKQTNIHTKKSFSPLASFLNCKYISLGLSK